MWLQEQFLRLRVTLFGLWKKFWKWLNSLVGTVEVRSEDRLDSDESEIVVLDSPEIERDQTIISHDSHAESPSSEQGIGTSPGGASQGDVRDVIAQVDIEKNEKRESNSMSFVSAQHKEEIAKAVGEHPADLEGLYLGRQKEDRAKELDAINKRKLVSNAREYLRGNVRPPSKNVNAVEKDVGQLSPEAINNLLITMKDRTAHGEHEFRKLPTATQGEERYAILPATQDDNAQRVEIGKSESEPRARTSDENIFQVKIIKASCKAGGGLILKILTS